MKIISINFILILSVLSLSAQSNIDLDAYKQFLEQNQNLNYEDLLNQYSAGYFTSNINNVWQDALYADSIEIKYGLTAFEKTMISENGFVVTERLNGESFGAQLADVFHKDMPVYVSSDAILHAIHRSYDKILKEIEIALLIPKVKLLLQVLHEALPQFANRYTVYPQIENGIVDLDLYLTVPRKFFNSDYQPNFSSNIQSVNELYNYAIEENFAAVNFFSSVARSIDFSQFKPRGHYVDQYNPELEEYFRVMIWLGKMELYLLAPNSLTPPSDEDVQRQAIMAVLLSELIDFTNSNGIVEEIESTIKSFVGDQDNVTLENLRDLMIKSGFESSTALIDTTNFQYFQEILKQQPYADQKILSQVLFVDPFSTENLTPASSFMLFGQRFVIDSYITGSLVYDKISFEGLKIRRMLPSTLDILFALGNDASIQLLKEELEFYHYSGNLSALRYLVDQNRDEFWNQSIYNNWLNSIRSLNPPADRSFFQPFMQTAAWWQLKINSQLSSWTELRHDNLLYAKQSYTGGAVCSYPYSFVEPVPSFFNATKELAASAIQKISSIEFPDQYVQMNILQYFNDLSAISDTLESIAAKELAFEILSDDEQKFLKRMMSDAFNCVPSYSGWYTKLYYQSFGQEGMLESDYLVADYHTAPTDEGGAMVGWVKHAGTGPVDMAIFTAEIPTGEKVAFIGPVSSYYEYTSTNFLRLTDDEWQDSYLSKSTRPDLVYIYLTDNQGNSYGEGPSLITNINPDNNNPGKIEGFLIAQNYPNPFNPSTVISFSIPRSLANNRVKLSIHNITGELVNILFNEILPAGNYKTGWNGENSNGNTVSSGIYFYNLETGGERFIGKMNFIK